MSCSKPLNPEAVYSIWSRCLPVKCFSDQPRYLFCGYWAMFHCFIIIIIIVIKRGKQMFVAMKADLQVSLVLLVTVGWKQGEALRSD